jgi:pyruvate/2-oxoglutarate dehydrogenase complex dihydrolipoamide dehydrogenase (E3) component
VEVSFMKKAEYVIIGFGKGGKTLAATLGKEGHKVILVEQDKAMYGGTCINVACIPTKALVSRAELSAKMGGGYEERNERFLAAIARKDVLTGKLRDKNYHKLADNPAIEVIDGKGSFVDEHHVKVGNEVIEGDTIIINTGARPFIPPIPGIDSPHIYVSETLLNLKFLPKRFLIIGGGYIGLEFASMFLNFGSDVTMVQVEPTFIGREDEDLSKAIEEDFAKRGLKLYKNAQTKSFSEKDGLVKAEVVVDGKATTFEADAVLIATGRKPNLEGLAIEKAGVKLTERGAVAVDEHNQTSVPNIYAVGDVVGGLQFTYISLDDSRIVLSALNGGNRTNKNRGFVPYSVFIDPPFSRIGLSEKEAKAAGYEVMVGSLPAAAIPKANVLEKPQGLLKVIINKASHEILGAHLYCAESHEMINQIKMAMDNHIPYEYLRDQIYTHPTMSEAFNDLFALVK